jgi:hypothetical protein
MKNTINLIFQYLTSHFLRSKSSDVHKKIIQDTAALSRNFEERSSSFEVVLTNTMKLVSIVEERSRSLEVVLTDTMKLVSIVEERSRSLEVVLTDTITLVSILEERSRSLEADLKDTLTLIHTVEERSRTLEYEAKKQALAADYQNDLLQRLYVESMPAVLGLDQKVAFNASRVLILKTDYPIAVDSNDHISPDSTTEGVSRPTLFVQNCISLLGQDMKCLDLGTGAAGLVFEFAMNQVLAVGVDGSDFCRLNKIGYWPILSNNLFTCDITKPFSFISRDTQGPIEFEVITMWEVLEHIAENDLPDLFSNIAYHLSSRSYFIGSVSLLEYTSGDGIPYHITKKPREWWKSKMLESGLAMLDRHPFNEKFFCRGNGPRFQDFHNYFTNPSEGFLFVAQKI